MTTTFLLNEDTWDLVVGPDGNLAFASGDAQIAQDVASAVSTWFGECWYNTALGMPFIQSILGKLPTRAFLKSNVVQQALTVSGVTGCTVASLTLVNRALGGTLYVTTNTSSTPIKVNL